MGQALSSTHGHDPPTGGNSTSTSSRPFSFLRSSNNSSQEQNDTSSTRPAPWRRRRRSSQMLHQLRRTGSSVLPAPIEQEQDQDQVLPQPQSNNINRRSRLLQRAHSSISTGFPGVFRRRTEDRAHDSTSSLLLSPPQLAVRPSLRHTISAPSEIEIPPSPLSVPTLDMDDSGVQIQELSLSRRRHPVRTSSLITDRLSSLRPERLSRTVSNSLRRRRTTSSRGDDQIPALSQLLSAAAAATAQSLMGDDPDAVRNARGIGGDEGTLESFLESLQNGRMADTLNRTAGTSQGDENGNPPPSVNFVRLFRFGTPTASTTTTTTNTSTTSRSLEETTTPTTEPSTTPIGQIQGEETSSQGRMVPIIIVGIRSINPNANVQDENNFPTLFDALTGFAEPATPPDPSSDTHPRLTPNSRFSHRRRSLGGLAGYDNQRHQRLSDFPRPFSSTSETSSGPRPPPSTPASTGLSAFSSGATTPTQTISSTVGTGSAVPSRRGSLGRSVSGLDSTPDDPPIMPRRTPRRRRLSESDFTTRFGSGSSRRNGVVEPDDSDNSTSRSWIIYVLGGSYPEDHPLLNTPSLFTDQPTYEDMLLLSSLIGPAKPPVASEDDIASAPGLFTLKNGEYPGSLIGTAVGTDEIIVLAADERCLVCLCDFEETEEARKLVGCGHIFHKDCIDQWLTTGRNSCPLCRAEGVQKSSNESMDTDPPTGIEAS